MSAKHHDSKQEAGMGMEPAPAPNEPTPAKPEKAEPNIETIRAAILAHRGGHEQTDDAGLRRLWESLTPQDRQDYLKSIRPA